MEFKIINSKDLFKNNPSFCLSAVRFNNGCVKCSYFRSIYRMFSGDLKKVLKKLSCKPLLKQEHLDLLEKKRKILDKLIELNEQLNDLDLEL